jgi:HAMP domain-containing protein
MEKSKQITHQGNQTGNTSAMFWGTIALGVIGIVAVLFTLVPMLQLPREGVVYFGMVLYSLTSVAGMTVIILTLRGRQDLGAQLAFYMVLLVFMSSPVIFVGRALTAFSSLFAISGIIILQLLPRALRRRYITITGVALILIWVLEWINPSWRLQTEVGRGGGPVTAIIFGLILAIILIRQAWGGNIRLKLVTSFTVIALISVGIVGTVIYINYRNQVREDIRQRLFNILSLVAMNQDGDLHSTILGPEDANDESHLSIMAQNVQYLATDPALKYIYTMRKNEQGQIYFVINARQGGEPGDPIGTIYNEPSELLATNFDTLSEPVMEEDLYTDVYGQVLASYAPFYRSDGTREGIIGVDIDAENVLAAERSVLNLILGTTVATMFLVTLLGLWLGNLFVGPVVNLSHTTQKIIDGDLSARAEIETADEVGDLAKAFNTMTSQLQGTLQGLEQRIADRTRNLELAAEVGRAVSQVRSLDVMLKDACELILKEFNLYYVQVYLTDASSPKLNLEAGTGSVGAQLIGRGHNLPLDTGSINGRAAVEKRSVVISDTSQSAAFRQNPLLPETRGEMAVPLIVANKVVGVLDMQSREPGVLSKEVLPAFEALAGQLAVAIPGAWFAQAGVSTWMPFTNLRRSVLCSTRIMSCHWMNKRKHEFSQMRILSPRRSPSRVNHSVPWSLRSMNHAEIRQLNLYKWSPARWRNTSKTFACWKALNVIVAKRNRLPECKPSMAGRTILLPDRPRALDICMTRMKWSRFAIVWRAIMPQPSRSKYAMRRSANSSFKAWEQMTVILWISPML